MTQKKTRRMEGDAKHTKTGGRRTELQLQLLSAFLPTCDFLSQSDHLSEDGTHETCQRIHLIPKQVVKLRTSI